MMLTLDTKQAVMLGLLCAASHWLIARSEAMRWFWGRMHGMPDRLLRCAACSGWWLAMIFQALGVQPFSGWPPATFICTNLLALFLTPVFEGMLLWGLDASSMPAPDEDPPTKPYAVKPPVSRTDAPSV